MLGVNMNRKFFDILNNKHKEWKDDNLFFSYSLSHTDFDGKNYLILSQNQTGFKLRISLLYSIPSLEFTSFKINSNNYLRGISKALHETALLELIAQGLCLSILVAKDLCIDDVTFLLSREEARNLELLNYLFDYSSLNFTFDVAPEQVIFSVWAPNLNDFYHDIEKLKNQIQQKFCWIQGRDYIFESISHQMNQYH